ncbi:tetratricopeptide repeat-containing sensor histidine kinase [Mangrovibacterium diazotrophicum]|uniref:histidine kinase n=1 Tax=Mangrovibacterium diazotrophicum TaxID=1261403 RepID=A0A419WAG3_9BACT|nr:tetratricopeptide repeat protein [Mangrovibacterium diazotrophicum]RKD92414.1 tetratricopeptide repeat protein [Mangrovibacterium diazotrophicum]
MPGKQLRIFPFSISLLVLIVTTNPVVFSTPTIDSLRNVVLNTTGKEKITKQLELSVQLADSSPDEAEEIASQALIDAKKTGNNTLIEHGYFSLGRILETEEKTSNALSYYDSALTVANAIDDNWVKADVRLREGIIHQSKGEEATALESFRDVLRFGRLSENHKTLATAYSIMGNIYRTNGLYDRAIEYIIKAKLNYEKTDFNEGAAWASYLLGLIYVDLGLPDKAMEHFQNALTVYKRIAEIDGYKGGIAICYEQIGLLNMKSGDYSRAFENIDYSLKTFTENGSQYGISNAYKNLGKIEYERGNYSAAKDYLNKSLRIKQNSGDLMGQPPVYEYLGLCHAAQGQTTTGLDLLNQALELAIANKQKRLQTDIYAKLTEVYLNLNNLRKAVDTQNKQIEIQDSLLFGAVKIKMEQLQSIYEIDEKNSEIAELEKQNEINFLRLRQHRTSQTIMISTIFLALLIAVIIYFFYRKLQHKNAQLNEAVATKDKFFSIVAHDLRGPIGSALTLSEFLIEEIEKKNYETVEMYASVFHQALGDSFTLLNNLLDWSRSQLQRMEFHPQFLALSKIVDEATGLFASPLEKKHILLSINIEDDLQIMADEAMLKTILRNLISNAIKYSKEKGEIEIAAERDKGFITLSVADKGLGMAQEKIANLFSLENHTSSPGTFGEQGTGLGLILVNDFVGKHNGKIRVESTIGKGTTFIISLPLEQDC